MNLFSSWIIYIIGVVFVTFVLQFIFSTLGFVLRLIISVIAVFFLFQLFTGFPALQWLWDNSQKTFQQTTSLYNKEIECTMVPSRDTANSILTQSLPAIHTALGPDISKDISLSIIASSKCSGKAAIAITSKTAEGLQKVQSTLQSYFPNMEVTAKKVP